MNLPSLYEAEQLIADAERRNPGPWVSHSLFVSRAAEMIASADPSMDSQAAAVLGLLHDIGRREGVTGMRHVLDGYNYLMEMDYPAAARISLTHSFPTKNAAEGAGGWDGTIEEFQFVQNHLDQIQYDLYDHLIQLCDSLALPDRFCIMEQRLVDVVMRYGFSEYTIPKWKAYFAIKSEFEQRINGSIYAVLPGISSGALSTGHPLGARVESREARE